MIAVISLIIHLISAIKIACQKKKYQMEDNRVYIIRLPPNSCSNNSVSNDNAAVNPSYPQNTTRYNPILYQLGSIIHVAILFSLYFVILIFQTVCSNHLSDYAMNFLPGIMINTIFPLIFYVQNPKARRFIVSCLVSR